MVCFIEETDCLVFTNLLYLTTMRNKGAKLVDTGPCMTIYDLLEVQMKVIWFSNVLQMNDRTFYSIIQSEKLSEPKKSRGCQEKQCILLPRRLRMQVDYNPFKYIDVRIPEFNFYNDLELSDRTIWYYLHKSRITIYLLIQTREHYKLTAMQ